MPDPSTATTNPVPQDTGFDSLEFWIRYKSKILLYGALIIVALAIFGLYKWNEDRVKAASEAAFSTAKTADDFRKVAEEYPRSIAGANAQLMLADRQRADGKLDDAIATLRSFVSQHPDHPLISVAWTSLASALEAKADFGEALTTYQKVTMSYPTSATAPVAFLGQARVLAAQGKSEDARRIYETVIGQFQNSPFAMRAQQQVQLLKKQAPEAAPSAPAEGTAPAAATPTAPAPQSAPAAAPTAPAPSAASPSPAASTPAPATPAPAAATPAPPAPPASTPAPATPAAATPEAKKPAAESSKIPADKKDKGKTRP
jgi:TolA-binding protein